MGDSGDRIAPITYLFGAPAEPAAPADLVATAAPDGADGWYVDGATGSPEAAASAEALPPTALPATALPLTIPQPEWQGDGSAVESARLAAARAALIAAEQEAAAAAAEREREAANTRQPKSARVSNVSMHALARKGMSSAEMTRLLESRELEPDDVAAEVDRLEGAGLLDDNALAETLVRTLQDRKGLGKSAISAELRRRKVGDEAISLALESIDVDDELERAIEVATKRAGQLSSYDRETAKRRLGAYLQRRGYGGSVLTAAMAAALDGGGASTGPRFR